MLHCAAVQAVNLPCKKSCLSNPTRGLCTRRHINVISKSLSLLREDGTAELQTAILSQINLYGRNPLIFPFAAFCFTLIDQLNTEKGDRLVKKKMNVAPKMKYLPSNLLCLETKVLRNSWLVSSTRFSKSCLLCWPNLSSISWVQHVVPWGHTRRCSPATQTENSASVLYLYQTLYIKSVSHVSQVSGTLIPDS